MNEIKDIPKHWQIKKLGEVAKVKGGKRLPKGNPYADGITRFPYIRVTDFENQTICTGKLKYLNAGTQQAIKNYIISKDDVYISIAGTIGLTGTVPSNLDGANLTENAAKITELKETYNKYISFFLSSVDGQSQIKANTKTTTQPKLSLYRIEEIKIPLPPLPEQQAIVAKIEELFSSLDKGIESLKTAQQQLKVYRQSVLKWAFDGKLTNKNVKAGELPKGWKRVMLKEVAKEITDGDHQPPPKSSSGIPFITISNVDKVANRINFLDTFKVSVEYYNGLKGHRKPQLGDVLYTVTGSFGIPILIDFEKEFCFQRHIGLIRPLEIINQKYLYYVLQTNGVFHQASETATGTAQKTVSLNSLRNFTIPFCNSLKEQQAIVSEIEDRLSVCDKIEESIVQSLQQSEVLRQSILKQAFEGKLVPQDSSDNPASVSPEREKNKIGAKKS